MTIYELDGIRPEITEDFHWIAPTAIVIGNAIVHPDVSIWFGTTVRGDNEPIEIGAGTNIQENCVLHTDPGFPVNIGEGCTIGHKAMIHGCTIGRNSLIGMGATVLNGARIGDNCLIGAGALVPEGKEIPDNSLVVGMPGKVIRTLGDDSAQGLRGAAEIYIAKARIYAKSLKPVS